MQGISTTTAVSVDEQPLADVTVSIYVPAADTTGDRVFAPETILPLPFRMDQANCTPAVVEEPLSFTVGESQVIVWSSPALAFGFVQKEYGLN